MVSNRVDKGKRFSRRVLITHETDCGPIFLQVIDTRSTYSRRTVEEARDRAVCVLTDSGVPVDALLAEAPHGSLVREHVLSVKDEEPDALAGIAAQLLEVALHLLAYMDMGSAADKVLPGLAFQLGRLDLLLHVYEVEAKLQAGRRRDKPLADPYDASRNNRLRAFHARLVAEGHSDATKLTAEEFELSDRQVRNIIGNSRRK
ncbi:hypothetical protein AZOA_07290 [Azoarcus sp. Aa7]|nr:hypothetical protein [Azoarcus sp. Aa7]